MLSRREISTTLGGKARAAATAGRGRLRLLDRGPKLGAADCWALISTRPHRPSLEQRRKSIVRQQVAVSQHDASIAFQSSRPNWGRDLHAGSRSLSVRLAGTRDARRFFHAPALSTVSSPFCSSVLARPSAGSDRGACAGATAGCAAPHRTSSSRPSACSTIAVQLSTQSPQFT